MKFTLEQFEKFEATLTNLGYRKYNQNLRMEDFAYWKSFERDEDKDNGYSVGMLVYDYSKYPQYPHRDIISVSLEFMLGSQEKIDRLDLTVSDDKITLQEFEIFCKKFFEFYKLNNLN